MADRSVVKIDRGSVAENDPLYELTRIMGIEPVHETESFDDFDLDIDLEKELLGEFAEPAPQAPAPMVLHRTPVQLAYRNEPQVALRTVIAPMPTGPLAPGLKATVETADAEQHFADFGDDLDLAMESELARHTQPMPAEQPSPVASAPLRKPSIEDMDAELAALMNDDGEPAVQVRSADRVVEAAPVEAAADERDVDPQLPDEPEAIAAEDISGEVEVASEEEVLAEAEAAEYEVEAEAAEYEADTPVDFMSARAAVRGVSDEDEAAVDETPASEDADFDAAVAEALQLGTLDVVEEPPVDPEYSEQDDRYLAAEFADEEIVEEASSAPADLPPTIDTIEVPEEQIALADDLEIPEVVYDDQPATAAEYDDLETEFNNAFHELSPPAERAPAPVAMRDTAAYAAAAAQAYRIDPLALDPYQRPAQVPAHGYIPELLQAAGRESSHDVSHDELSFDDEIERSVAAEIAAQQRRVGLGLDEELAMPPAFQVPSRGRSVRRGMIVAALVASVAVIGGVGVFAFPFGDSANGTPALVKADPNPMKVKPANRGGTAVPNQDNKVYEQVSRRGEAAEAPSQPKLVTTSEEPVDIAPAAAALPGTALAEDPVADMIGEEVETGDVVMAQPVPAARPAVSNAAPAEDVVKPVKSKAAAQAKPAEAKPAPAKGEDRVAPAADEAAAPVATTALPPRRVKTMVVKPDGTLAPREEPVVAAEETGTVANVNDDDRALAAAVADAAPLQPAAEGEADVAFVPPAADANAVAASETAEPAQPVAKASEPVEAVSTDAKPVKGSEKKPAKTASAKKSSGSMPASGPVAPSRPADQPVDIVGEVRTTQVAAAEQAAAPVAAVAGGWSMQIASQPSEQSAQSSYQDLARRYGGVIGGRGVNIVKAEIPGKGTYWRVRVAAGSKSEANSLCQKYKSAGGSCFVTK